MAEFDPEYEELEVEFGEVMEMLREGPVEPPTEAPSEDVWAAIAREVGGEVAASLPETSQPVQAESQAAPVVSLDERRSRGKRFAIMTAVAAAVALVAVPLALAFGGDDADRRAELLALEGFDGMGTAELAGRTLDVDLEGLDAPDGSFYELWLLELDDSQELLDLRSLGPVEADGSFVIPEDVDLSRFDVVDVSVEPDDGNPDHSGASVLRGGLQDS